MEIFKKRSKDHPQAQGGEEKKKVSEAPGTGGDKEKQPKALASRAASLLQGLSPRLLLFVIPAVILLIVGVFLLRRFLPSRSASYGKYTYSEDITTLADNAGSGIGSVEVTTMDLPVGINPLHAVYTPSGRVLVDYMKGSSHCLCTMEDDGSGMIELYVGKISEPYCLAVFPDNQRILAGTDILSCLPGQNLDDCEEHSLESEPLSFPGEIVNSSLVTEKMTDVILSPDGNHIAWRYVRSDIGPCTALGVIIQTGWGYEVDGVQLINTFSPYEYEDEDAEDSGILTPVPNRNGRPCQFVRGGTGILLAGYASNGMPDGMVLDIASGKMTALTNHPSYDGQTMLSPSEEYGITMSTRFSATSNLEALGYVPRPQGDVLLSFLDQIEGYSIKGVYARERKGSVGPVLFRAKPAAEGMSGQGINLADTADTNWIYLGDLSWNADSTRAMWMERRKDGAGSGVRIRIARLLEASPRAAVSSRETPRAGSYADQEYDSREWSGTIEGPVSGQIVLSRTGGMLSGRTITLQYENYTEDGEYIYNGIEIAKFSGNSVVYTASLSLTDTRGEVEGSMDVRLAFTTEDLPHLDTVHIYGSSTWQRNVVDLTGLAK